MSDGMIEPSTPETREERHARQTKEQFEALGRFVQEFQLMENQARFGLQMLLSADSKNQRLLNIILHHPAMSSSVLMTVLRSVIAEIVMDVHYGMPATEREVIVSIIKQINDKYDELARKRNELLHGTWHIGWANPNDTDFSELNVFKFKSTTKGFQSAIMPKVADDLNDISKECDDNGFLLKCLIMFMTAPGGSLGGGSRVSNNFQKTGGVWKTTIQRG